MTSANNLSPEPQRWEKLEPARVPRRFGMGILLVFTVMYAALFALLRSLDAHPAVFVVLGVYFTAIGLAQMLVFGGKRPREASVLVGSSLHMAAIGWSGVVVIVNDWSSFTFVSMYDIFGLCAGLMFNAVLSVPIAYLAGCMVAGVFLVIDRLRSGKWNASQEDLDPTAGRIPIARRADGPEG